MATYRRLPVYLLLDCSESMAGPAYEAMVNGVKSLILDLKKNPVALETVAVSIIAFASSARQDVPLTDLFAFKMPTLTMGSGTAMGSALRLWLASMEREVMKNTLEQKGDFKPICFLLTDGQPTDDYDSIARKVYNEVSGKKANLIAVACGPDADVNKLRFLTDTVILMKDVEPGTFSQFFKWVTASVSTSSERLDRSGGMPVGLDAPRDERLRVVGKEETFSAPTDERFVYLHAKCRKTGRLYLMKYEKKQGHQRNTTYIPVASYPVEHFEISAEDKAKKKVSTEALDGNPPCPYCGSPLFAFDGDCGNIFCIDKPGKHECPWCHSIDKYEFATFDVGSGKG